MKRGFTLVDLVALIAIIVIWAILLSFAWRREQFSRDRPFRQCASNLKQIGVGLEIFAFGHGNKFPLEIAGSRAGDVQEHSDDIPITKVPMTTAALAARGLMKPSKTIRVPDVPAYDPSSADAREATTYRDGTTAEASILFFARLYGKGSDWSASGGKGVISDSRVFDCCASTTRTFTPPHVTSSVTITDEIKTYSYRSNNFDLSATTMGEASPVYGANLLISYSSAPNAISAGDIIRSTPTDPVNDTVTDNRKGINHNGEGFSYLYRDGHVARKKSLNGTRNVIDDSSLPAGDAATDGDSGVGTAGTQTEDSDANVENIFLF